MKNKNVNPPAAGAVPKWTPWPWKIDGGLRIVNDGDGYIADASGALDDEQTQADLRLIAAAPDLYEALAALVKGGAHDGPCDSEAPEDEGCGLHWQMYQQRIERALAALERALPPKAEKEGI